MRQAESISTSEALRRVYAEGGGTLGGGVRRLCRRRSLASATPLLAAACSSLAITTAHSWSGDTAANTGVLLLLADPSVFGGEV